MEHSQMKGSRFNTTNTQSVSLWTAQQWKQVMDTTSRKKS